MTPTNVRKHTMTEPPATQDAPPSPPSSRSAMMIVFLVVFIDLLGFGIVLPLLPLYAKNLLLPLYGEGQEVIRGAILGVLMASFSFMQFVFSPLWGRLSDRIGRRPIILMGLVGSVLFYTLFGFAAIIGYEGHAALALTLMFVARLGAGLSGATIATAQAVIADVTPAEKRAHGMALIGAAFGIGFTFGPLLGFASLLIQSPGAPGFMAAAMSLIALVLAVRMLPETCKPGVATSRRGWLNLHGLREVLRMPTIGLLVGTFFMATLAFGGLESTLALVNQFLLQGQVTRVETSPDALGEMEVLKKNFLIFAYVGLILVFVQGFFYRRLVQKVGEVGFMRLGIVLMILGLLGGMGVLILRQQAGDVAGLIPLAMLVFTLAVTGFAFLTPSVQSLISRRSDPARQGEVLGVNQSAAALARILGPLLSITLFFTTPSHVLPYVVGASLLGVVFFLILRIKPE